MPRRLFKSADTVEIYVYVQKKLLGTYTALGSDISKKWTLCAFLLPLLPLGKFSARNSDRIAFVQPQGGHYPLWKMYATLVCNECIDAAAFAGLRSLNIQGDGKSIDVIVAHHD